MIDDQIDNQLDVNTGLSRIQEVGEGDNDTELKDNCTSQIGKSRL